MSEREAREQATGREQTVGERIPRPYTGERWRQARRREFLWAATAAALALIYALGVAEQQGRDATAAIAAEQRAFVAERIAAHYAGTVAGCMNGGRIVWTDPHTGADMGTFCDTHRLSNGKPR